MSTLHKININENAKWYQNYHSTGNINVSSISQEQFILCIIGPGLHHYYHHLDRDQDGGWSVIGHQLSHNNICSLITPHPVFKLKTCHNMLGLFHKILVISMQHFKFKKMKHSHHIESKTMSI